MVAISGGPFWGANAPKKLSGKFYNPPHCNFDGRTMTITANLAHYVPYYVQDSIAFAGLKFFNSGVGDNGKKVRVGVYTDIGGPGALIKDVGEVILTGASAVRSVSNSFSVAPKTWIWLCLVSDTTPALYTMGPHAFSTAVGYASINVIAQQLGSLSVPNGVTILANTPIGDTASLTYGALPSTAAVPTATLYDGNSAGGGSFPWIAPYV